MPLCGRGAPSKSAFSFHGPPFAGGNGVLEHGSVSGKYILSRVKADAHLQADEWNKLLSGKSEANAASYSLIAVVV